jgi:predicted NAD/FAD-binding protein
MANINGENKTWFAGAWMGNGFHEDGMQAGKLAANAIVKDLGLGEHD